MTSADFYTNIHTTPTQTKGVDIMTDLKKRNKLVEAEIKRMTPIFEQVEKEKQKFIQDLILQAARTKILLDEMWIDISEKGDYEMFSQSENQIPYERERPVAKNYNNRVQIYQRIIKQLTDYLPEEKREEAGALADGSDLL